MTYNELTRWHFDAPRSAGVLEGPRCFRGAAGSRSAGTWVQFDLSLAPRSALAPGPGVAPGRGLDPRSSPGSGLGAAPDLEPSTRPTIAAAHFLAFGCPHVIAACDLICDQAVGLGVAPELPESVHALRARLDAPIEKLGRLLVMEDAWRAAARAALAAPGY